MRTEADATDIDLGIFEPLKTTAEIIDFMQAVHSHKPKTTQKKTAKIEPSTPIDEVWAKDGYVLSDGDCAEWIAKADYGMFFHGDALSFFTKRGNDIVRIVRHAKNHAAPAVARKYTLKITADENSSPEQKAMQGVYSTHRLIAPEHPEWKKAGKTRPFNSNLPDPTFSGHINHCCDRLKQFLKDVQNLNQSTHTLLGTISSIQHGFEMVRDAETSEVDSGALLNISYSKVLLARLIASMQADVWDKKVIKSLSDTSVLLDNIYKKLYEAGRPTAPRFIDDENTTEDPKDPRKLGGKFNVAADEQAVGEMYTEARQATGLTKVAAAELAGMPETSVRKLEKGSQSPTLKTLRKYAKSLGYEARIELVPIDKS